MFLSTLRSLHFKADTSHAQLWKLHSQKLKACSPDKQPFTAKLNPILSLQRARYCLATRSAPRPARPPKEGLASNVRFLAWKDLGFWWEKFAFVNGEPASHNWGTPMTPLDRSCPRLSNGPSWTPKVPPIPWQTGLKVVYPQVSFPLLSCRTT